MREWPRSVVPRFSHSVYADYLFYLFYRDDTLVPEVMSLPLELVPPLEPLVALPELVASSDICGYRDIFPLLELYRNPPGRIATSPRPRILAYSPELPSFEELYSRVVLGEAAFPAFLEIWTEHVRPEEERTLQAWKVQNAACEPLKRLQILTRLAFPASTLDVVALLFHPAGSANYSPPGVYSGILREPDLAWTLGHEASHLLVDVHLGANWQRHPLAHDALARARAVDLEASDIEEALCLLMQVKLAQTCGTKAKSYRISDRFGGEEALHALLVALEDGWDDYLGNPLRWPTVVDYLLGRTLVALKGR